MTELALAPFLLNLPLTVLAVLVTMAVTMAVAFRRNDHSIVDIVWGLGFVVIAATSWVASAGHGDPMRRGVVLGLVAAWGLRLGWHIARRNAGHVDPRYVAIMKRQDGPVVLFVIRRIYGLQGVLMWVVSLPTQLAMYEQAPMGIVAWIGVAVVLAGLAFEIIGDRQLAAFKADPANRGRTLETGLWAWTRHPNYFGDALLWFGLWLLSLGHWAGLLLVGSPLLMTHILLNWSGKALTERRMARSRGPEYEEYLQRVSGFLPRPPRAKV